MPKQRILFTGEISWIRPLDANKRPYSFGARKTLKAFKDWNTRNCIYLWIRNSDGAVAYVGECGQALRGRIRPYESAFKSRKGRPPNLKVADHQRQLIGKADSLLLEYTTKVPGYNLSLECERKWAEKLIIGVLRPYLQPR